jgi:hypothetical protein
MFFNEGIGMSLVSLLLVITSAVFAQQTATVSGSISGVLKGEDGTTIGGGTILLHLAGRASSRFVQQRTDWTGVTAAGGVFQFAGLPEGTYTLCVRGQGSGWLNPCEWNLPTPTATISRTNPNASVTIILKRGAVVPVRIDDAGQLLAQHEGRTRGAGLFISVSSPGYFFRLVPLVAHDSSGRNYEIVIPYDTPLTLVVHPSFYRVNDASGAVLSQARSTKVPLLVTAGQKISPIRFTVAGTGP